MHIAPLLNCFSFIVRRISYTLTHHLLGPTTYELVKPRRWSMAMSSAMVEPDVVSMLPCNRRRGWSRARRCFRQGVCGSSSQADVSFRIDEAEEGDGPQDIAAVELGPMFQGRAGNGHEGVDGNGLNAQFGQADGHVQAVFPGFPHADDAAGTETTRALLSERP